MCSNQPNGTMIEEAGRKKLNVEGGKGQIFQKLLEISGGLFAISLLSSSLCKNSNQILTLE